MKASQGVETSDFPRSHLPQLDSVRGIACLLVLAAHLNGCHGLQWIPSSLGPLGVGIFFSLSGFLITRILLHERSCGRKLGTFYNRRAARILPVYLLTLAVVAIFWPGREVGWAATFCFNLFYLPGAGDYFRVDTMPTPIPPVAHTWSLCVEEHFYWVWPVLVWLLPLKTVRWLPIAGIAATPFITSFVAAQLTARNFQPPVIDGFLSRCTLTQTVALSLGCVIAFHEMRLKASWPRPSGTTARWGALIAAALVTAAALWVFRNSGQWPPWLQQAMEPTLFHLLCGALFMTGLLCPPLGRIGWLRSIGSVSYGAYLFHLPIYTAIGVATSRSNPPIWRGGVAVGLTLCLAILSFHFIEKPILAFARGRRDSLTIRLRSFSFAAGTAVMAFFAMAFFWGAATWTAKYRVVPERLRTRPSSEVAADGPWEIKIPRGRARRGAPRLPMPIASSYTSFRSQGVFHEVDAEGYRRSTPFPLKRPGVHRIAIVGDSYAFGECVENNRTVSAELQRLLSQQGFLVEVLNVARRGAQVEGARDIIVGKCRELDPEIVIYAATFSDFLAEDMRYDAYTGREFRELPQFADRFRKALAEMREECAQRRALFVPIMFTQFPNDAETRQMVDFTEGLFRDEKVDYVPLAPYLKEHAGSSFPANEFDNHPNAECHGIYAQMLSGKLQKMHDDGVWLPLTRQ